ncbi:MAG: S9 family peptidase [Planctomycetes bacterium]|nr:S9 family peptidase [Planctomycetota bacterium]
MCRPLTIAALAAALLAPALRAQRARDLSLEACFGLDQFMLRQDVEPRGWVDAERFLAFDDQAGVWQARPASNPAAAEDFVPRDFRAAFAALPGLRDELIAEATAEADAFTWAKDHSGFVVAMANDLFWYDRGSGAARRLTRSPAEEVGADVSPDGSLVAYVQGGDLFVVPVDGGEPLPLTADGSELVLNGRLDWVYQEEVYGRGNFKAFWWSPDSTRIAFLKIDQTPVEELVIPNDRPGRAVAEHIRYPLAGEPNPIVALGIADVGGGPVRWVDMGEWRQADPLIVRVTWRPDGSEVFYQVQDREQRWLRMLAADATTGGYRPVFMEGSPCWVEPGVEPLFLKGGEEFLWLSERDGFEHIYRYRADGELVGRLTEGRYDAEKIVHVDEAGGRVYFLSDKDAPTQQNLFAVGLAGGAVTRLTTDDGWHEVDFAPDGSRLVDEFSAIDHKLRRTVRDADGNVTARIVESDDRALAAFGVQRPEFVTIPARDGFPMEALVIRPRNFDPAKKYAVLCHIYAGPKTPQVLDRWSWRDFLWHCRMAQRGYLVFLCDNRSASGKGRESACAAFRSFGQSELRDLEDGVDWLLGQGYADPERVAIWGWSYGGYQTLYNLTHSKKWSVGVAVNPVTDWRFYDSIYTERYMGLPQTNVEGYSKGSVLEAAANLNGHLLLVHSTMDENVHMRNSLALSFALQQARRSFRFMPYPHVRHGIEDFAQQLHLFDTIEAFLDEHLDGGRPR